MSRPQALDVVIANHGYARYLPEAIDSALGQTSPPRRVIVVDDGSEDDSREVIGRYGDRVVPVLKAQGGQASAVNAGFARSEAEVVVFLDADDVLEPRAGERILAAFAARPGLARVHFPMVVIDDAGRPTGARRPPPHQRLPSGDQRVTALRNPFDVPWASMSGNAFHRDVLRRILPAPEEGPVGADWYLVHVSSLYGPVAALDEPLARYRVHGANGYATADGRLDVESLRATARFVEATRGHVARHAATLGLAARRAESMSDVAVRMTLLRLDPRRPPAGRDTRRGLLARGARAARDRRGARWAFRGAFLAWLGAMAVAPSRVAPLLAALFLIPERRRRLNPLLARLSGATA